LFSRIGAKADVLLLCGDLVDYGLPEEAAILAKEISAVKIPILAVLGNHEFESGQQEDVKRIFSNAGVMLLDGDAQEINGVGFAGVKGFAGGFGERALGPWGEEIIKRFVHEAIDEALKLESALARLRSDKRIVLLHYSPIQSTVVGEPPEIFPFLGSSRLEEPLNRYPVTAVFHGHAHHGTPEGRTKNDVPVYNVAMKLLQRSFPDQPSFRVIDIADR
jgi:Icc-related predicted phosphoesterase